MLETKMETKVQVYTYDTSLALKAVIQALGHDASLIHTEDLQAIADRLSLLAKKEPGWGWRYLRNVINGKLEPSTKLAEAVKRLKATIDGTPDEFVKSERVSIQAVGHVAPGALVLADSKRCANPGCRVEFVPRVPWQKCHSTPCSIAWRKMRTTNNAKDAKGGKK
jgi:hypothetical protein